MTHVVAFKAGRKRKSKRRQRDVFDSGDIGIFGRLCKQAQAVTSDKKYFSTFANKAAARIV